MSERMENALRLADKCWAKAYAKHPEFVEAYLKVAEAVLLTRDTVTGDMFREHCRNARVFLPAGLHPNTWVSGVRALNTMGWIHPLAKVDPECGHNHMPQVTLWKSMLRGAV